MKNNQSNNPSRTISTHLSILFNQVTTPKIQSYLSKKSNPRKLRRNLPKRNLIKKIKSLRRLRTRKGMARISSLKITKHLTP
jgi:hypothetical protein